MGRRGEGDHEHSPCARPALGVLHSPWGPSWADVNTSIGQGAMGTAGAAPVLGPEPVVQTLPRPGRRHLIPEPLKGCS